MARAGRALRDAIRAEAEAPPTFRDALRLLKSGKSERQLAREMGVPRSTLKDWLKGARPSSRYTSTVDQAVEEAEPLAYEEIWDTSNLRIHGRLLYAGSRSGPSKGGEEREIALGPYLRDGAGEALRRAYERGASGRELGEVLHEYIHGADFYEKIFDPAPDDGDLYFDVEGIDL